VGRRKTRHKKKGLADIERNEGESAILRHHLGKRDRKEKEITKEHIGYRKEEKNLRFIRIRQETLHREWGAHLTSISFKSKKGRKVSKMGCKKIAFII